MKICATLLVALVSLVTFQSLPRELTPIEQIERDRQLIREAKERIVAQLSSSENNVADAAIRAVAKEQIRDAIPWLMANITRPRTRGALSAMTPHIPLLILVRVGGNHPVPKDEVRRLAFCLRDAESHECALLRIRRIKNGTRQPGLAQLELMEQTLIETAK